MRLFNQHLNNKVWNYSPFQIKSVQQIEKQEDFKEFVCFNYKVNEDLAPEYVRKPGPFTVLWYDKSGTLHCERLGVNRLLHKV